MKDHMYTTEAIDYFVITILSTWLGVKLTNWSVGPQLEIKTVVIIITFVLSCFALIASIRHFYNKGTISFFSYVFLAVSVGSFSIMWESLLNVDKCIIILTLFFWVVMLLGDKFVNESHALKLCDKKSGKDINC
jgi:hypothetical protein